MSSRSKRCVAVLIGLLSLTAITACGKAEEAVPATDTAPPTTSPTTTSEAPKTTLPPATKPPTTPTTAPPVTTAKPAPTTAKPLPKPSTTVFVTTTKLLPYPSIAPQSTDPFCRSISGFRPTDQDGKPFAEAFNDWQAAIIGAHQSAPPEFEAPLRLISDTFQTAKPLVESGEIANRDQLFKWLQKQGPEVINATTQAAEAFRSRCMTG
jgi:hypothetical protein